MLRLRCIPLLMLVVLASASPFHLIPAPSTFDLGMSSNQATFGVPLNYSEFCTLKHLHDGNRIFRDSVPEKTMGDKEPTFMFFGCTDNRLSPSAIFNAPASSIITHNNIGNLYSSKDPSASAAVAYAAESSQVQHIIVLGHYGCKGAEAAITMAQNTNKNVRTWIRPISKLYSTSRRAEIVHLRDSRKPHRELPNGLKDAPPASNAGFRALVEENVKRSVSELRDYSFLSKAYSKPSTNNLDVFVHGFVYDETTREVVDLRVSFGPPGKQIPRVPFETLVAAQKYHHDSYY